MAAAGGAGPARADLDCARLEGGVKDTGGTLLTLALQFSLLSFLAIGGAISALPEMHRQAVDVYQWMTSTQFAQLVAIAQAAPGPNVLIVTLIGQQVAGIPGALIATICMCGPACAVAFHIVRAFHHFRESKWAIAVQAGLVPVSVGLVGATAFIVARSADQGWGTLAITAATFALAHWTRVSPLWALAGASALGLAGVL
jgi:chromate transporter